MSLLKIATDRARLKRTWQYTLEVLTPLHISEGGAGERLRQGVDFVAVGGKTPALLVLDPQETFERIYAGARRKDWRSDTEEQPASGTVLGSLLHRLGLGSEEATAAAPVDDSAAREAALLAQLARGLSPNEALAAGWLTPEDIKGNDKKRSIVRYRLYPPPGTREALLPEKVDEIRPTIKDAYGRPYVPGTSLKGALRTVLAERLFAARLQPLRLDEVQAQGWDRERRADDQLARPAFVQPPPPPAGRRAGRPQDPNYDLLRALLVGDSDAAGHEGKTGPAVALAVVGTFSVRQGGLLFKPGFFAALEALPVGTQATGEIRLDQALFTPEMQEQLRFRQDAGWLADLAAHCNTRARALIQAEIAFYQHHHVATATTVYQELLARLDALPPGACLLQMGWGTGWLSKTLGLSLAAQAVFPQVRELYRLGHRGSALFPKTRRLTLDAANYDTTRPGKPLGWVQLTLDE